MVAAATVVFAQPAPSALFFDLSTTARDAAIAIRAAPGTPVGMRLEFLFDQSFGAASTVLVNIDDREWLARFQREDSDSSGFRSWVGALESVPNSHVVFTVRDGIVSGLIDAVTVGYQVRTISVGTYVIDRVDPTQFRPELSPLLGAETAGAPPVAAASPTDDGATIDVLLLYTDAARTRAGGSAQIEALISQIVSDSNTAFTRSGVVRRFRLAGSGLLPFTEASSLETDLLRLTNSSTAQGLRNVFRADIVQLLVSSPDLSACGIGWLLTGPTPNFDAFSVADVSCVSQYTPTHEMGHNMGSHHAPEDGASGTALPYSYGYKDPMRGFRTIMAYPCAGGIPCTRILNFSNPSVFYDGFTTGTGLQNNGLSLNLAAYTVANWRQASAPTPPAPTGLVTQVKGSSVTAIWDPVHPSAAVTNYLLQVGSAPGRTDLIHAFIGNRTSISGFVQTGTFYWRVVAVNEAGLGQPSSEAQFTVGGPCVPPGPPRELTVWLEGRTVHFKWLAPVSGTAVTNYILEVGSLPGWVNIHNASTETPTTRASTPAPPGIYFTRFRAQNECGISQPSREVLIVVR
jgi:hypothetical protein